MEKAKNWSIDLLFNREVYLSQPLHFVIPAFAPVSSLDYVYFINKQN